ncbi:uncharacterized protein K02A2.6-like [Scomber scombrus]|uniref:Uncharacterized protein K02A2.6-like n=1 Tax=Scomber scombrus TaxID=13677 RepID=A0AAV1PIW9_SCOSC
MLIKQDELIVLNLKKCSDIRELATVRGPSTELSPAKREALSALSFFQSVVSEVKEWKSTHVEAQVVGSRAGNSLTQPYVISIANVQCAVKDRLLSGHVEEEKTQVYAVERGNHSGHVTRLNFMFYHAVADAPCIAYSIVRSRRELCQKQQKQYYNRYAKTLPALPVGATIRFQLPTGTWKPAMVIEPAGTQRSCNIITDGGHTLRHNRCDLLRTCEGDTVQEVPTNGHKYEPEDIEQKTSQQSTTDKTGPKKPLQGDKIRLHSEAKSL